SEQYNNICGITETELAEYFKPEIQELAKRRKMTYEETLAALKKHYDGYHFSESGEDIYNPYSLLNAFNEKKLRNYWFETGTPTFLAKMVQRASFINIKSMESEIRVSVDFINSYRASMNDPFPILYQSGYLTIKGYDKDYDQYVLGFPNEEVEYGFLNELMGLYMQEAGAYGSEFDSPNFVRDLNSNNVEGFMTRLRAFFASMSNRLKNKDEKDFQTVFYLLFKLMGQFVETEYDSAIGRADAVVFAKTTIYVFEFKMSGNGTAEDAMRQINDRKYTLPFTASGKNLVKVGVEFSVDKDERNIVRWTVG
ncbi:MAG: ATP-binding protein, partial [Prevotellaceae bacterium]|nr:ATP-binding protein [Prevotellaceae bacterium]